MIVLSDAEINSLLSFEEIIDAVEKAFVAYENGEAHVSQRMHIPNGDNTLLCMPSFGDRFFGTKLVSVVPANGEKNLPVTNGAMVLNDRQTGLPLALLNASKLTALRTGAVGALGVKYMTPQTISSMGLIGIGVQGIHQALVICAVRDIATIFYLKSSSEKSKTFTSTISKHYPHVKLVACESTIELLSRTSLIIAATTSAIPVVPNEKELLIGKHFISIGSYSAAMQELPDAVYQLAGEIVIDSEFARNEVGDVLNPIKNGWVKEPDVYTLGKVITGKRKIVSNATNVFKSTGMALFDLFVAQAMYEKAQNENKGTRVSW